MPRPPTSTLFPYTTLFRSHLRLVLTKGINEYPRPGHPVHRATYDAEYADILRKEGVPFVPQDVRSEEHTSELQSRPHLVCRLLLEKKKKGSVRIGGGSWGE